MISLSIAARKAAAAFVMSSMVVSSFATIVVPVASAAVGDCTTGVNPATLVVNVTQDISNDPDSGNFGGDWALDNFTRTIKVWSEGDHFCGQAFDHGTFTTFGGATGFSPQSGIALPAVVTGSMNGGTGEFYIPGTTLIVDNGGWHFTGSAPSVDCNTTPTTCSNGLTGYWMNNYFGTTFSYDNWSWTYVATNCYGTWTNSTLSTGDIIAPFGSCPEALNQHLTTDAGVPLHITLSSHPSDLDYSISTSPSHGTLSCATGDADCTDEPLDSADVTYTPAPGFSGSDSFDFTASNGDEQFDNDATIYITVNPVVVVPPPPPSCPAGTYTDATDYTGSTSFEAPTFSLGSISGQNGWSNAVNPAYDQAVVSNTYGYPTFGAQSFRISDAVTSGSFGDWVFAAPTANAAGEADSTDGTFTAGTLQNHFETQFNIASAVPCAQQAGLHVSVSPDRGDGSRLSYLRFEDGVAGIDVFFDDVQGTTNPANFVETQIATGLDRTVPHTVKMTIDFVDGPSNDVVKVWIDGALVHTGTSWENYYRFDAESAAEQSTRIVKTVIIQARGTATPTDAGKGFLFDNLSLSTGAASGGSGSGSGGGSVTSTNPQCSDGIDNDNDGRVDYPGDNSCSDAGDNSEGNDGGSGGGSFSSAVSASSGSIGGGVVLGASTDIPACSNPLLTTYMGMGRKNTSGEVTKLQNFLNLNINAGLTVNGIFDSATDQAVKNFQVKYWQDVLAPWKPFGLGDHQATGYVYKTTQRMINMLSCSNLNLPAPQLP